MYRISARNDSITAKPSFTELDSFDYCQGVITNRIKVRFVLENMIFSTLQECQAEKKRLSITEPIYIQINGKTTRL